MVLVRWSFAVKIREFARKGAEARRKRKAGGGFFGLKARGENAFYHGGHEGNTPKQLRCAGLRRGTRSGGSFFWLKARGFPVAEALEATGRNKGKPEHFECLSVRIFKPKTR